MAFVIKKKSKKGEEVRNLYYLVVGYREAGKSRRKTVLCMEDNPDLDSALKSIEQEMVKVQADIQKLQARLKSMQSIFIRDNWRRRKAIKNYIREDERKLLGLESDYKRVKSLKVKYFPKQR